jgi:hypothetical protein
MALVQAEDVAMARAVIYCDLDRPDAVIDEIVAACSGDMVSAVKALLLVNEELESELTALRGSLPLADQTSGEKFASLTFVAASADMRDLGPVLDHEEPLPHPASDQTQ